MERRRGQLRNRGKGIVHENTLWVPFGVGDHRIRVFSVTIDELLTSFTPC